MTADPTALKTWTKVCHQILGGWEVQIVTFTKCVMCMEKYVLIKNIFTNEFATVSLNGKDNHRVERHSFFCKENVSNTMVSKEGHAYGVLGNGMTHYWFPWKTCNC